MTLNSFFSLKECGKTFFQPNVRVVGGVQSVSNSWPAQVLIFQNYIGYVNILGNWYQVTGQVFCGGTIIDAYTIVSAASCVKQQSSLTYSGYPLQYVSLFYPTLESMFNIYAGVSSVTNSPNDVKLAVKKVVVVSQVHLIKIVLI